MHSACRIGKGTHFAIRRLSGFLRDYYKEHGSEGFFLKCDIRKYFDSIDHTILKQKMSLVVDDRNVLALLYDIIDSYETKPGKGLSFGNQTSQWFALYNMDEFDRFIKNDLKNRYYTRYMDDCVLIHHDREYIKGYLEKFQTYLRNDSNLNLMKRHKLY